MFTVTDLKQMSYCPRIVYYGYCLPGLRVARTHKMALGAQADEAVEALEHRRSLRAYGLRDGTRQFDVWLESDALGLRGRLDMLVESGDELIPVDYKDSASGFEENAGQPVSKPPRPTKEIQHNWALQLTTYALLVEAVFGRSVRRGFIYYIPARRAREVRFTQPLRDEVMNLLGQMQQMIEMERQPGPTPHRARCDACEFRRFCNDV
jgi:CRISPR-associated exonuclease Cas4